LKYSIGNSNSLSKLNINKRFSEIQSFLCLIAFQRRNTNSIYIVECVGNYFTRFGFSQLGKYIKLSFEILSLVLYESFGLGVLGRTSCAPLWKEVYFIFLGKFSEKSIVVESKIVNRKVMYFKISSVGDRISFISSTKVDYLVVKSPVLR